MVTREPQPREGVYDLYWEFAAKRHQAFLRRYHGEPGPWSDDPILQEYKFTNVFRILDRVSQYMVREVCYSDELRTPEDALFQITVFRMFSRNETWERLRSILGNAPTLQNLADGSFEKALTDIKGLGEPIYTGAFILCANNAYGRGVKHLNHAELFTHMFLTDNVAQELLNAPSLEAVYTTLRRYPLYGDFMAYQTAIDLNYSGLINFSENDFTVPGPGALRGIKKMFIDLGDYSPAEVVHWMVARQGEEFARLGLAFNGLWGRKLHAIDVQGLFCEVDKYCRVRVPELSSSRSRIKARFVPNSEPIALYFPPKWGILIS